MQFKFGSGDGYSGFLAFTPPGNNNAPGPLLLVADVDADAVHLVDVVGRSHAGYVAPPGSMAGPRGVAASGISPLVAVSVWKDYFSGEHVVVVYRGGGTVWEAARVIGGGFGGPGSLDGQLKSPLGLRFGGDGSAIFVADANSGRASVFRVGDGGFVKHIATGLISPWDVEEVEGGWLVACCGSHTVEFVCDGVGGDGGGRPSLGKAGGGYGSGDGEFWGPTALAVVPGLGLVVREAGNRRLQVFATPDAIAMATMSPARVAWMAAVARGVFRRLNPSGVAGEGRDPAGRGKKRVRGSETARGK
jgi:DNA-binding beta-propeller fold protein YncE